jgi:phage gpG-like protein
MQFGAAKGSLGSGAPWGNIPARAFLGVSDEDRAKIHETIEEWLAKVAVG